MLYICQLLLQPRFANLTDATGGKLECFYNQFFSRHAESHQLVVRIFLVTSCGEISVQVSIPTCVTSRQASGHLHWLSILCVIFIYYEQTLTLFICPPLWVDVMCLIWTDICEHISISETKTNYSIINVVCIWSCGCFWIFFVKEPNEGSWFLLNHFLYFPLWVLWWFLIPSITIIIIHLL